MSSSSGDREDLTESEQAQTGDLFELVYKELKGLAISKLANEPPEQTLNATSLVHEAFLRLENGGDDKRFENTAHLYATAAEVMRWILIDRARSRKQIKRGGDLERVELVESQIIGPTSDEEMLEVDGALKKLTQVDPESAELVKMRFFAGFTLREIAEVKGVSYRTMKSRWSYAKAWLKMELGEET